MQRPIAIVVLAGVLLCGCASITTGTSQKISITTTPIAGVSCALESDKGTWRITTPGTVEVEKSTRGLAVKCSKPGYEDASATIPPKMQPWSVVSMVLTGPVGIFVDTQTGAINRYPDSFAVPMTPLAQNPVPANGK